MADDQTPEQRTLKNNTAAPLYIRPKNADHNLRSLHIPAHGMITLTLAAIEPYAFEGRVNSGELTICAVNKVLVNKTARRISISPWPAGAGGPPNANPLIIAPYGQRLLSTEVLERYNYDSWVRTNFVDVHDEPGPRPSLSRLAFIILQVALVSALLALFVSLIMIIDQIVADRTNCTGMMPCYSAHKTVWGSWLVGALLLLIVLNYALNKWNECFQWLRFFAVASVGLVIPLAIMCFLISPKALVSGTEQVIVCEKFGIANTPAARGCDFAFIGFSIRLYFILIVSILPGLLYFFFYRQKLQTLRKTFIQDVIRIDPNIQTTDDAESIYGQRINDIYGSGDAGRLLGGAFLPILICTFLVTLGWVVALQPFDLKRFTQPSLVAGFSATDFAFFGAYFFGINMIFRRYVRSDLGPKAYSNFSVRIVLALILVWLIQYNSTIGVRAAIRAAAAQAAAASATATASSAADAPETASAAAASATDAAASVVEPTGTTLAGVVTGPIVSAPAEPGSGDDPSDGEDGQWPLFTLAFLIGFLPETGLQFIKESLRRFYKWLPMTGEDK